VARVFFSLVFASKISGTGGGGLPPRRAGRSPAWSSARTESISTNGANRPTQRPRVHNVWRCHWLSKRRAKTKQITSETWARLDVSGGGPLLWHASIPTDALHRISMTARSSRNCLQATGHAFHWLSWSEQGTRGWLNNSGHLQTGLVGVALPFKLQKKGDPARPPRDVFKGLENVSRSIYGQSQPCHTLVLERIPATSAPTVQTAKPCHFWLFGRLEPLVETL